MRKIIIKYNKFISSFSLSAGRIMSLVVNLILLGDYPAGKQEFIQTYTQQIVKEKLDDTRKSKRARYLTEDVTGFSFDCNK